MQEVLSRPNDEEVPLQEGEYYELRLVDFYTPSSRNRYTGQTNCVGSEGLHRIGYGFSVMSVGAQESRGFNRVLVIEI
jgi:hypothetical protein